MTISPRHVWLTTSKMVVRNPADPIYASEGYPSPIKGLVLRNANVTTGKLRDGRQFTPDTAEVAVAMMEYGLYSEAEMLVRALTEATFTRTVWGQAIRFVTEAYFPGTPYEMQLWEAHTRTACLFAYALGKWANHDNTPINGITPRQWAIDILFSVRRTQLVGADRIGSGEQPAWTAGAIYENWNLEPTTSTATPSWELLSAYNQDVVELAVAQLLPHGSAVTTTQGASYDIATLRDEYRSFISACHARPEYFMPVGLPHQRVRLDGSGGAEFVNWYTPGTVAPNPIGHNATWTTDAMAWIIRGRALSGAPVAPLVAAFKALLVGSPPTWYDAFNADGSRATDGEVSQLVTQAPAIMYLATAEASDMQPDASLLEYVKSTQLDMPSSDWGHGSWTWTGDPIDHIEAVTVGMNLFALHMESGGGDEAVDQETIEYGHVYASYVKSIADTPADPDADPDIVHVNGQVTFDSTFPGASARGSIRLPADPRAYGLIVTGDTFEIVNSKLVDHEGREGVRLIASVDGVPISWQAIVTLTDSSGRTIYNQAYIIHYDLWHKQGNLLDINLPDLIPTPSRLEPPEGAAIELAERTIEQIEALTATNQQVKLDVQGLKSEVVTLHGQTGQRLTAAEAAKTAAETARTAAQTARTGAETARTGAESARDTANTHRVAAQTARTGAEGARDAAAATKGQIDVTHDHIHQDVTHADTHALAAGASAQTATTKALEASTSAGVATTKASEAAQSRADALTFRNTAQGAATTATDKAGEAATAATTATTKAAQTAIDALTLAQRVSTGAREIKRTSDGKPYLIPESEVTEVNLRVDTTVGTRVFLGDVMIYGDTGWRDVTSSLLNGWTAAALMIRRIGNVVHVCAYELRASSATDQLFLPLPQGFAHGTTGMTIYPGSTPQGTVRVGYTTTTPRGLTLEVIPGEYFKGAYHYFDFMLRSNDSAWPTSLPGNPS